MVHQFLGFPTLEPIGVNLEKLTGGGTRSLYRSVVSRLARLNNKRMLSKDCAKEPRSSRGSTGIMDFWDLSIDISLEVQNQKCNQLLYLLDYIAPGPQF